MEKNKDIAYAGIFAFIVLIILRFVRNLLPDKLREMPFMRYVLGFIFPIFGLYVIVAVHEQPEDFVSDKKYAFFKRIFGENGVRVFYYLLGLAFISLGISMLIF